MPFGISKLLKKVFSSENIMNNKIPTDNETLNDGYSQDAGSADSSPCSCEGAHEAQAIAKPKRSICHCYYEVGGELLAKPNGLCDILEAKGLPPTLIFCNSPSDTDFVEVLLKKRGINATKLIGYVPPAKVSRTIEKLHNREISVIVITDIAARGLDLNDFDLSINYSVPVDADIYLHRCGIGADETPEATPQGECRCVASLISPLDIANFHFIKKTIPSEFHKQDLPPKESLLKAKAENIRKQALDKAASIDEGIKKFASVILETQDKEAIVALLLHNTLEVIPQLNASIDRATWEKEFPEEGTEREGRRDEGGRGEWRGGGRDRDRSRRRGDRRDDRRGGDRNRDRGRSSRQQDYRDEGRDESEEKGYQGSEGYYQQSESQEGGNYETERESRRMEREPRVKEDRLYIGHGSSNGFTQEKLVGLLTKHTDLDGATIKRFSSRKLYSFADVGEEVSEKVISALSNAELESGEKFYIKRAVSIVAPRPERPESDERAQDEGGEDMGEQE